MDSTDARTITTSGTGYLVLGPFLVGECITELNVTLSAGVATSCSVAPAITQNGQASAAAHGVGTALIARAGSQVNGINAATVHAAAGSPSTLEFKLDRNVMGSPEYIIVAVTEGGAGDVAAFANGRSRSNAGPCAPVGYQSPVRSSVKSGCGCQH